MKLVLGTSKWNDKKVGFQLLDLWAKSGYSQVDTATNYPIDLNPAHFRLSENIIAQWLKLNQGSDLKINVKIGSINNFRTPENDLSPNYINSQAKYYIDLFQNNLECLMIHWDNRSDINEIQETISNLNSWNIPIGFSGITDLEIYSKIINFPVRFQVKYSKLNEYLKYFDSTIHDYYVYRVNEFTENYEDGIRNAWKDDRIAGLLIGPKNEGQLINTLLTIKELTYQK